MSKTAITAIVILAAIIIAAVIFMSFSTNKQTATTTTTNNGAGGLIKQILGSKTGTAGLLAGSPESAAGGSLA